ncbi:MAG: SUMF1/EgtB/PvdO family nonheme iron enzyme [Rhodoferax sp.]|nr:SUMF1/EgtB/PvdO family nonheme iron enzyme [Rhodoferax sp.]MCF8209374.1 SUMF1/EgtB/PvdO family nonheme iron enzyme [Rhodoferax sp.]
MHSSSFVLPVWHAAHEARTADASQLADLLCASRARTLALVDAYAQTLGPALPVPYAYQLNPPLWELGHIGWFQEFWVSRNPQRLQGVAADPACPRAQSLLPQADTLYNSSLVPHPSRWTLVLPDLVASKNYLAQVLQETLALLNNSPEGDAALYFYRLALLHEDMHSEAAVYMAQALGLPLPADLALARPCTPPKRQVDTAPRCQLDATNWQLGSTQQGPGDQPQGGFVFDNELMAHTIALPAFEMDSQPVSWQSYLPFVAQGGYTEARWWSEPGWQWLQSGQGRSLPQARQTMGPQLCPRYLRQQADALGTDGWQHCHFGQWQALDLAAPACHLSYFEAQAWCCWAGRQLPTEAQWELAALRAPDFQWGEVWEWTASIFAPYPGFVAHPYRDYSAPWFGDRPVLRGASLATSARMAHPNYRNYFAPERNDVHSGFRTCALTR